MSGVRQPLVAAYVVARVTSKTEIRKAEIGAETERLRIAEDAAQRWDTRRDLAHDHFNELSALMWSLSKSSAEGGIAQRAHDSLERVLYVLGDVDRTMVDGLLAALSVGDLDRAQELWPEARQAIINPGTPSERRRSRPSGGVRRNRSRWVPVWQSDTAVRRRLRCGCGAGA